MNNVDVVDGPLGLILDQGTFVVCIFCSMHYPSAVNDLAVFYQIDRSIKSMGIKTTNYTLPEYNNKSRYHRLHTGYIILHFQRLESIIKFAKCR